MIKFVTFEDNLIGRKHHPKRIFPLQKHTIVNIVPGVTRQNRAKLIVAGRFWDSLSCDCTRASCTASGSTWS